jgi:hypothetical protein
MSMVSWIGLPFDSWYTLQSTSPSVDISTALVEVEPPSTPTKPADRLARA